MLVLKLFDISVSSIIDIMGSVLVKLLKCVWWIVVNIDSLIRISVGVVVFFGIVSVIGMNSSIVVNSMVVVSDDNLLWLLVLMFVVDLISVVSVGMLNMGLSVVVSELMRNGWLMFGRLFCLLSRFVFVLIVSVVLSVEKNFVVKNVNRYGVVVRFNVLLILSLNVIGVMLCGSDMNDVGRCVMLSGMLVVVVMRIVIRIVLGILCVCSMIVIVRLISVISVFGCEKLLSVNVLVFVFVMIIFVLCSLSIVMNSLIDVLSLSLICIGISCIMMLCVLRIVSRKNSMFDMYVMLRFVC